jgi:2-succinyl-6-hydroxy-2,4-cyclohexadiene-1-carboxylate synthase
MKVKVNGIHYHVEMVGEGFPLVLLHGFTGNGETWLPFCERWSAHSKLVMVDIIGHGQSDAPENLEHYEMEQVVDDLSSLLDHLKIDKADFLGYSMGGRLALSFGVKYPEKVRKLVLESASPGLKTDEERAARRQSDEKLASFIREEGIKGFVDYWENIPLFQTQKNLSFSIQEKIREQRLTNSVTGLVGSLIGMGTGAQNSCWNELERLSCEVLLITGELDKKFCSIAIEMQKKVNNSKWTVVDSCGHAIHVEEDEKFGTIVSEFLKST